MVKGCHTGFSVFLITSVLWQMVNLQVKKSAMRNKKGKNIYTAPFVPVKIPPHPPTNPPFLPLQLSKSHCKLLYFLCLLKYIQRIWQKSFIFFFFFLFFYYYKNLSKAQQSKRSKNLNKCDFWWNSSQKRTCNNVDSYGKQVCEPDVTTGVIKWVCGLHMKHLHRTPFITFLLLIMCLCAVSQLKVALIECFLLHSTTWE